VIAFDAAFVVLLVAVVLAIVGYGAVVVRTAAVEGAAFDSPLSRRRGNTAELGRVAFLAHRLSGFAILAFLALHILDIGLDGVSRSAYDRVQHLYGSAPLRIFECGLLFAVLFHTGNGLRLLALDLFGLSERLSRGLLAAAAVVCAVGGVAGSVLIIRPLFA
jgi:succinate dehydrogenase / fumarate reductase cytochrome b subunit